MRRALILALLLAGTAHAEFKDGNRLYSDLTGDIYDKMHGMGYIVGVYDMGRNVIHCGPANVTAGQINDMIKNYLENVPLDRSLTGDTVVNKVLRAVWPCAKRGNSM